MSELREDLKAYVDGELSPERTKEIEQALAADPSLLEEVEWMKAIGQHLRALRADPTPAGAETALARLRKRPLWRHPALAGVGLAAVFVAILFPVFSQSRGAAGLSMGTQTGAAVADAAKAEFARERGPGGAAQEPVPTDSNVRADKGSAPAAAPVAPRTFPQLLIRTAELTVKVESVKVAMKEASRLATANGGFVSGSQASGSEGQLPQGFVTLRVPVAAFDRVCDSLRQLGVVLSESTNTDDVTAQVADVEARLKVMRAEEESYVTMLRAARRVGELLEIKERLSQVRQEIESIDAQRKALRDQASYSTINATFTQKAAVGSPEPPKDWSGDAWTNAVNGLQAALRWLGTAVITVFVYAPLWLPLVLVAWWLVRRASK